LVAISNQQSAISNQQSAIITSRIMDVSLVLGDVIAHYTHQRFADGCLLFRAIHLFFSSIFITVALHLGNNSLTAVVILLSMI
jgi:hypothetical protein